ncbi:hypothetical protein FISHEDRAFT_65015 [Fistulina hepatica ATCC 64428]|uniref:Calcineurin-like phosphoesterase domain-containing protein n=1 Tax=Fistulina hepatica ATCC 64428 TaxID=1128425 RepID=A0A0D7AFW0_9AGAR|nr:hypothetical protein FISHEDRAFT_65015 [Fistulina hepatica ATCC 64428]
MSLDDIIYRRGPTAQERFLGSPKQSLLRWANSDMIRLVCISDTHNAHQSIPSPLPGGDILMHAGDLTNSGTEAELDDVLSWLAVQPHAHEIFIGGNHDVGLSDAKTLDRLLAAYPELTYLEDSETMVTACGRSLRIFGSPRTPRYGNAHHLDAGGLGCEALLRALWVVRPLVHVFGHVHAGRGVERVRWSPAQQAQERLCAGIGEWLDIIRVVSELIRLMVFGRYRVSVQETTLVNAACVHGWRDELRGAAFVVDI